MTTLKNYMGQDGFVWFIGVVEDRNDPLELGRVRVRCLGYHTDDLSSIPTSSLPWAHVMHPTTDPAMHGMGKTPSFLVEGGWVCGFFRDSRDKQQPVIIGTLPGIPETSGGLESTYTKGFNDPRHKNSTQTNLKGGKDYAMPYDETFNPNDRFKDIGGEIEGDLDENVRPDYGKESYGPYPLGGFVNGKDDKDGVFARDSGHTFGESDTNRLARGAGHGVLAAKDGAALTGVMLPHSDQKARDDDPNYSDAEARDAGIDIYGNKVKKDDKFLDAAGNYSTMAGKSTGPNATPRPSFINENTDINDKSVHPIPAAAAPQSVDASGTADAINPLMNVDKPELTNEKWNEPKTTDKNKNGRIRYAAKYPYNHVFESESGHIKEYDDTPGSERIHEYHTSGTFYEVDADGAKHVRVVGNNYEVIHGTDFVNIKGDVNLTIESNCKTYIKGDWNIQVDGNKHETIGGSSHETIGGNHISLIRGEREQTVETNVIETYGTDIDKHFHTRLVTGSTNDTVLRNVTETYGTKIDEHSHSNTVVGKLTHTVQRNVTETYGTDKSKDFRKTEIVGTESLTVQSSTTYDLKTSWAYTVGTTWTGTTGSTWDHESLGNITIVGGPRIDLNPSDEE
jgi:hypothetical protein